VDPSVILGAWSGTKKGRLCTVVGAAFQRGGTAHKDSGQWTSTATVTPRRTLTTTSWRSSLPIFRLRLLNRRRLFSLVRLVSHLHRLRLRSQDPRACVRALLHPTLLAAHAELSTHLTAADVQFDAADSSAQPLLSARWVAGSHRLPRVLVVWESAEVARLASTGGLVPALAAAQAAVAGWHSDATLSLVVVGRAAAGVEQCLSVAQLELGLSSVRRALHSKELAELLACHTDALAKAQHSLRAPDDAARDAPDFLAGLTAHDVLHNRGVPKALHASWLFALKQLLPESAAVAVHAAYPSFRRLYSHLIDAERAGREPALAELRVAGGKRLGPARSRKLVKVLMASRFQAFDTL
jgi:hypothetical protein